MKAVNHPLCSSAAPRCAPAARRDAGPRAEEGAPALRCAALLSAGFAGPGCRWSQPANLRQPLAPGVALRGRPHLGGSPGAPGRRRSVLRELWGHPGPRRKPPTPLTRVADTRHKSPLEDKSWGRTLGRRDHAELILASSRVSVRLGFTHSPRLCMLSPNCHPSPPLTPPKEKKSSHRGKLFQALKWEHDNNNVCQA